jgi:hypothetical protein
MSKPLGGGLPFSPAFPQSKTLFYNEGHPTAILVDRRLGKRRQRSLRIATAEAAMAWCRRSAAALLCYPARN